METEFEQMAGIRLLAQQSLIQVLYRSWGQPLEFLEKNLRRTHEALKATALQGDYTDQQIAILDQEFSVALTALQALAQSLPDTRPHPI
ncbi:hypothetical protein [Pseudoxanthomonas winnipegensis]|uniref:Uncharacterized protein n=1 Tax=Pseudoxanthomonas winnipegensis TaxID=2480810 RepID=A0A4Q8L9U5_9GAMM|nr:hypothetical protein [Pseudoxanthomonas winnipegensis]RZZ81412.1 hypothetical protein EA663_20525 [Pseudoxanthomonas winnipegensis]TAA25407.1 hypothetical protein EA660_08065 [Pseudoxanthomonas winnipegensis]